MTRAAPMPRAATPRRRPVALLCAIGAVALRFSNVLNGGVPGQYTIPDFRLAFFFVTAIGFLHLFGYLGLSPDAGNAVRIKKDHSADDASGAAGRGAAILPQKRAAGAGARRFEEASGLQRTSSR